MEENLDDIDWSGVSLETVRQIHALGETYMQAQLQSAIAADQRAVTMASILAATGVAVLAAGLTAKAGPALPASLTVATMLIFGAACGVWAAKPIAFWFPGNDPANWYGVRHGDLVQNLGGEAENYSDRIGLNNEILQENQVALMAGMVAAILAPIFGAVVWMIAAT